jgi:hypothetical protein
MQFRRATRGLKQARRSSPSVECLEPRLLLSTYDAAADFSGTANPNGVWSYGYTDSLGGSFHADFSQGTNIYGEEAWSPYTTSNPRGYPLIFYNPTSSVINDGANIL